MFEVLFNATSLTNTIIIIALIIGAFFLLYGMLKYQHNQPLLVALLCIAWLGLGIYSGVTCFKYYQTNSITIGAPVVHDPYEDFNVYEYPLDNIVWYETDNNTYQFSETYEVETEFAGSENDYLVLVNNTPSTITSSTNGRLTSIYKNEFYDLDGNTIANFQFDINFAFYASEIKLTIDVDANYENIGIVREWVKINGFDLRIIDAVYAS